MIKLYSWSTPNGRKISILLEEIGSPYEVIDINIDKNEQFAKKFSKISPTNKIPVLEDKENNIKIFESGAIMLYLANKHNCFLNKIYYWQTIEWFMFQMTQVGPYLGQAHQFLHYNSGKSKYAELKYMEYSKRVYSTLEKRLEKLEYLAHNYSIADIATWPWVARFEIHKINLNNYPNVLKWYKKIALRPAVIKGYNVSGEKNKIPLP
ncbi:MAG: Disulfide-bond oxidoreductase YfcG [Alphaproteobacteria bacterium MarineAlpha5_Bin9]|nr:MAG: Disulfide-bond oxidoreductase YfcG [Alphaproteobacteria bacterium MarineAlpha5_Bin9]|tara:strand:- start:6338 stop:6961 length:624 start_codon:yes stop_codon:yes gene_type:complete